MAINETINLGAIGNYASYLPRKITEEIVSFLNSHNLPVSQRWTSLMLFIISLFLLWIILKISQPIVKWILILLILILLGGLIFVPGW